MTLFRSCSRPAASRAAASTLEEPHPDAAVTGPRISNSRSATGLTDRPEKPGPTALPRPAAGHATWADGHSPLPLPQHRHRQVQLEVWVDVLAPSHPQQRRPQLRRALSTTFIGGCFSRPAWRPILVLSRRTTCARSWRQCCRPCLERTQHVGILAALLSGQRNPAGPTSSRSDPRRSSGGFSLPSTVLPSAVRYCCR